MTKYAPLKAFLSEAEASEVPMRFSEIEKVIHAPLPPAAFKHRAWWSNNPTNSVVTRAWLEAGYETRKVDMTAQRLVFRRTSPAPAPGTPSPASGAGVLEALRRALKGTVRVAPGVDLTAPTGAEWDAERQ